MLAIIGGERRHRVRLDPVKVDVKRRQVELATQLAPLTGRTPRELLDYERADSILARR